VNESLVPAEGGASQGASYSFLDPDALQPGSTWFYKLQEVEDDGTLKMYGPVQLTVPASEPGQPWGVAASAEAAALGDRSREISKGFNVFAMLLPPAAAIALWLRRRREEGD
jgi:hypothetical protein